MNEVAIRSNTMPSEHEMMVYQTVAEQAISSKMYPGVKDKSGIMMIMLAARELGIPPMQSLNGGLNIIQGKVEISARMMNALIRKAGHQIQVKESTATKCVLFGKRCDTGESQTSSFTVLEAQQAGLIKPGGGWIKWPTDMCFARALSRLARQLFSDVIGIGYVEGEIGQVEVKPNLEAIIADDMIEVADEREIANKFLHLFNPTEEEAAMQYVQEVAEHFKWTTIQTINELSKDEKRLYLKFNAWKEKNRISTEQI